jgi:hypothetical protein
MSYEWALYRFLIKFHKSDRERGLLRIFSYLFAPGKVLVNSISKRIVECFHGFSLEGDEVFDVGNSSLKEP